MVPTEQSLSHFESVLNLDLIQVVQFENVTWETPVNLKTRRLIHL